MTDDQRTMYNALMATRNTEVILRWTRTQIFFLIHSAGISFVVTQLKPGVPAHIGACIIGTLLGILWFMLTGRIRAWVDYWNRRLIALEEAEPPQPVRVFGGLEYKRVQRGMTAHHILLAIAGIFTAIWIGLGVHSIILYSGR